MTDLEIIKKCAEKMGLDFFEIDERIRISGRYAIQNDYDPLHDDAQAMALVKRLGLIIEPDGAIPPVAWWVQVWLPDQIRWDGVESKDLNRAICECVAKLNI